MPLHSKNKIYGEDYAYLLAEIRNRGHRRMYVDDVACDISEDMELDQARTYALEAVIDKFVVKHPGARDGRRDLRHDIEQAIVTSIQNGLRVGEGFVRFRVQGLEARDWRLAENDERQASRLQPPASFWNGFACPQHHVTMGELKSYYFAFNDPDSACRSCSGLGTYYKVHPHLLVVDPARSIVGRFSFNVKGGRCEECAGEGLITTSLHFMPDVESPCPICKGARYNEETLEVTYAGKNIAEILDMTVEEGETFFKQRSYLVHKIGMLNALGLGYLRLGQSSTTLSGGEAQRIKLASELGKIKRGNHNFYILDEPTTGLHQADIQKLLDSLNRLVDAGNTVLVIEHHLDVIKTADYVIDLGPDGGHNGGEIIVQGTPEEVARCPRSYTGQYLRRYLEEVV